MTTTIRTTAEYKLLADDRVVWTGSKPPTRAQIDRAAGWAMERGWNGTQFDLCCGNGWVAFVDAEAQQDTAADDLVLCQSPDGWSLHAPGSTDDEIASGDARYLVSGPGTPSADDYARALDVLRQREG